MIKLKKARILIPAVLITISLTLPLFSEVVEKIYAVVNDELITYSELKTMEATMTQMLRERFQGQELLTEIEKMKKRLLNDMIEEKILLSRAKEKNYDMGNEVEAIFKDLKKQYNLKTDEELKQAIESQGMTVEQFKEQLKTRGMKQRLIYEEIGSKIKIDNAAMVAYYKENQEQFTEKREFSLNCIYLEKAAFVTPELLTQKKETIDAALATGKFIEVAKVHSQLQGAENNFFLGKFKQGELDAKIEDVALKLKKDEYSGWIETETALYIVQLVSRTEPEVREFKAVRAEIENLLRKKESDGLLKEYMETIRKDSFVKIYEEYNQ